LIIEANRIRARDQITQGVYIPLDNVANKNQIGNTMAKEYQFLKDNNAPADNEGKIVFS